MRLPVSLLNLDAFIYAQDGDCSCFIASDPSFHPQNLSFRIASITKTLMAAFYLAKVAPHCPLTYNLGMVLQHPSLENITPQHLLSMRSGISDDWFDPELRDSPAEFLEQLVFTGNDDFCYANNNYIVLGLLCERVLGCSLNMALNDYFKEIGLDHTFASENTTLPAPFLVGREFDLSQLGFSPRDIDPNTLDLELIRNKPLIDYSNADTGYGWACGHVVSTPIDLATFFHKLLLGDLLSPQDQRAMKALAIPAAGGPGYGLGLSEFIWDGTSIWVHNGGMIGYYSHALFNSNNQRIVVACLGMFAAIRGIPRLEADYLRALAEACTTKDIKAIGF
jgi:D-alanyl-D-alanine carboxypeptidase